MHYFAFVVIKRDLPRFCPILHVIDISLFGYRPRLSLLACKRLHSFLTLSGRSSEKKLDDRVIRTKVEKFFDIESAPSNEMAALEGRSGNENKDEEDDNNSQNEDDDENKKQQQQSPASASPYASNEPSTKQYRATQ